MDKWYNFYWNIVDDNSFGVVGKSFNRFVRKFVKKHLDNTVRSFYKNNPMIVTEVTCSKNIISSYSVLFLIK